MHGRMNIKPKYFLPMPISVSDVHTRQFLWRRSIFGSLSGRVSNYQEINPSWSWDFLVKIKIIYEFMNTKMDPHRRLQQAGPRTKDENANTKNIFVYFLWL